MYFFTPQDASIPGYLPSELFSKCSDIELRKTICQRCTFLKNYNIALSINVDPNCYPKLLEKLKAKNVLIVLLVDMTDYPCSVWPRLWDIVGLYVLGFFYSFRNVALPIFRIRYSCVVVGADKPVVLVGNKIDLIPGDSRGWLHNAEKMLRESFPAHVNVIHTELISAKTEYGIESLITKLHSLWNTKGFEIIG